MILDSLKEVLTNIFNWLDDKKKYLMVILLYILYQCNFILYIMADIGININKIPRTPRICIFALVDFVYILILILMFKKEIKDGLKDLKENSVDRTFLSIKCWLIGCIIMTTSSLLLSVILKENVSDNEQLVRESIKLAPIYMLFSCSIVAPIFEELLFRRAIYGFVKKVWPYIFISGFSFGLLHVLGSFNNTLDFLYIIPYGSMGCAFAYLYSKTKNISLPILVHMIHNTILVIVQIMGGLHG